MKQYTMYIGLDDQHEKRQIIPTDTARDTIAGLLIQAGVEGATFTEGRGLYRYKNGAIGWENSIIVDVLDFDGSADSRLRSIVPAVKERLNQESIAYQSRDVESILL